jgi:hypothetical protein
MSAATSASDRARTRLAASAGNEKNAAIGAGEVRQINSDMKNPLAARPAEAAHAGAPSQPSGLSHSLVLAGLTPAELGAARFRRVYHCVRLAAQHYTGGDFRMAALYDPTTHVRTGYQLWLPTALAVLRVRLCHDLAKQGRPMPWRD